MDTQTQTSFSWLRQIPVELYRLDDAPLLGFPPLFPWKNFSDELSKSLQIKEVSISSSNLQWRSESDFFQGLGDHLKTLCISVGPLTGSVWWVMSEQSLLHLMNFVLNKESKEGITSTDESFVKAFYSFLAAEAANAFGRVDFDKKLFPTINKEASLPNEACLGLDITITIGKETIYGRLLLSQMFRKSWMQYYTQQQKGMALTSPIADNLSVIVHLEAGKVSLKASEWKQIRPGDFIILDSCSLDPDEDKGRVMLVINGSPFFRARIKQGSLKILEHPLYHEVNTPMATPPKNDEESSHDEDQDDADFDFDDEDITPHEETAHGENIHHDSESDQDNHIAHGEEDFDLDIEEETSGVHQIKEEAKQPPLPGQQADKGLPVSDAGKPLSVEDIPLNVVIEIGRIQMSVKKVLELQPGNTLDLDIHPESGVDLVVNGKRIAHGELLKIGDSLGIRILELS